MTFAWGNAIKTNEEKMAQQLEDMWQCEKGSTDEKDMDPTPPDFTKVDKEKVEETAAKINKILKDNPKACSEEN